MARSVTVGILLFDDVDILDSGGPYEVFLTAERLARRRGDDVAFGVVTIGPTTAPVRAYGGMVVTPAVAAADAGPLDVVIVPGAIAIDTVTADPAIMEAVTTLAQRAEVTSSVCTGAFILARAGLLNGRPWTTHWEDVDLLADRHERRGARRGVRWVDDDDVVTSGGLSSGIAMALHLVARFGGRDLAMATARQIEYDWDPEGRNPNVPMNVE
jgi:transcriptional regulator GlxA family with amidase domain